MTEATLVVDGSTLRLSGPATLQTAGPLAARGRALLTGLPAEATLDLSKVTRVDSAGVAMLVEFWRQREHQGGRLEFVSIPAELRPLLQLYGLETVFGTDASG
ncbi:lipid asymmetry maintenance protein MlaB [Thioalkalivibrio sp.]|uniref:STAS domain-containing protein n=1 Tax=Thioalkalivibrio sp. TaxID=2093813 RepID=UPI0039755985